MNDNIKILQKLIKDNPDLPVIPLVDRDVCNDDYAQHMGKLGCSYVSKYIIADGCFYLYDDEDWDEIVEILSYMLGSDKVKSASDENLLKAYKSLHWTKAIFIDIHEFDS